MSDAIWLSMLRGATEKAIDNLLSDTSIATCRTVFETMKPAVNNSDDATFGYIYGHVFCSIEKIFSSLNRQPTNEEMKEIYTALTKRTMEIKSRLNQTKT